jgi:hypothetical protein
MVVGLGKKAKAPAFVKTSAGKEAEADKEYERMKV